MEEKKKTARRLLLCKSFQNSSMPYPASNGRPFSLNTNFKTACGNTNMNHTITVGKTTITGCSTLSVISTSLEVVIARNVSPCEIQRPSYY